MLWGLGLGLGLGPVLVCTRRSKQSILSVSQYVFKSVSYNFVWFREQVCCGGDVSCDNNHVKSCDWCNIRSCSLRPDMFLSHVMIMYSHVTCAMWEVVDSGSM